MTAPDEGGHIGYSLVETQVFHHMTASSGNITAPDRDLQTPCLKSIVDNR
jgi:hypothetical protein